ncbi:MAG: hypothetical protein IT381_26260 [Deltaproteobacteria bacterium]|nr:hypothetical protein [Deltaproteobacteria bacterium]
MKRAVLCLLLLSACRFDKTTYRLIGGVSMGAIGASALGFRHPMDFDGVAALGGPMDAAYLGRAIERQLFGGFCSRADLEAVVDAQGPLALNDPAALAHCMGPVPAELPNEHEQSFSHWYFSTSGGTFDRTAYIRMLSDLTLAFGNPLYHNDASPIAPPGVDPEVIRHPPKDICKAPIVVPAFYNKEYNADGRYDAITFCDGEEDPIYVCGTSGRAVDFCGEGAHVVAKTDEAAFAARYCGTEPVVTTKGDAFLPAYFAEKGRYDPCREHTRLFPLALALDMNQNGRRDYGEPILMNAYERYEDRNGNWIHDDGEPYEDFGLDGVAKTGDFGEGNGKYDMSPARLKIGAHDPRTRFNRWPDGLKQRLDLYADGGVRDVFNFGVQADVLFDAVQRARPNDTLIVREPKELTKSADFDGTRVPWRKLPPNVLVHYGKDEPTLEEIADGDGGHVGTAEQVAQRFMLLVGWASSRWPAAETKETPSGGSGVGERMLERTYTSSALGADREYGIFLPPGYDAPGNDERYPVLYLLHGYGMQATGANGMLMMSLIFDPFMADARYGMRKMIIVYVDGRCCFRHEDGTRACTEKDDAGASHGSQAGWERECHQGSFYVDSSGYTPGDETPYERAFMELVTHVDESYRTLR